MLNVSCLMSNSKPNLEPFQEDLYIYIASYKESLWFPPFIQRQAGQVDGDSKLDLAQRMLG